MDHKHTALLMGATSIVASTIVYRAAKKELDRRQKMVMALRDTVDWVTESVITMEEAMPVVFVAAYRERLAYVILTQDTAYPKNNKGPVKLPFWIRNFSKGV